jgi:hypothetical protein
MSCLDILCGKGASKMGNLAYILYISLCIPLFMMLVLLEGKSRRLIFFMIMGITECLLASEINPILSALSNHTTAYVTTTITPISEEILKACPILFYAVFFSDDRQDILEISMAVGIGFALLENAWILINSMYSVTILWAFIRGFGSALMHGICCLFVGFGTSYIRRRKLFYPGIFAMMSVAIIYHASYNCLVQSSNQYLGILLPIITYIPFIFFVKKQLEIK